jgi:hypothetical protein
MALKGVCDEISVSAYFLAAVGFFALAAGPARASFGTVTLTQAGATVNVDVFLNPGIFFVETAASGGELFLFNDTNSLSTITNISATLNGTTVGIPGGLSGFLNLSPAVPTASDGSFTASIECTIAANCNAGSIPAINDLHFVVTDATVAQLEVANEQGNFFSAGITPIPAALPLFATGLGALGLLGWRKKRKARQLV